MQEQTGISSKESDDFDREAFLALADEFGGLAGSECKKLNGGIWLQDNWDKLMIRLYEKRHFLDGVEEPRARGLIVLQAFEGDPYVAMLERIERKMDNNS